MKADIKILSGVLLVVLVYLMHVQAWGPRLRAFRKVGRVVSTGVRKAGQGVKTGVRKTGQGLKKAGQATGKGLKKAGQATGKGLKKAGQATGKGLKKAGEVTGKDLYKGLRETGKALITTSNFVGDILDRINLMKFIWKKLGACCIPIPSLCRTKREYESVQGSLKYYNNLIDQRWKKVEIVFQWINKINENTEDIAYHVERITTGAKDAISPIQPPLIIQYNTKMNSIKQDVKWKNSSVVHLTRQGVTTFVAIEMAWQCFKVAKSVKSGLKKLKEARDKCLSIMRESDGFLKFLDQGWRQLKATLTSAKLKTHLGEVRDLCKDSHHSNCVKTINNFLSKISSADYGKTFALQEDLINALTAMKYSFSCLQRKQKVVATVSEYCRKGNEDFHAVFMQALNDFFPNSDICIGLVTKDYTTKDNVLKQLQVSAEKTGFYSSCSLNNKEIKTKTCLNYTTSITNYDLPLNERSRLFHDCKTIVPSLGNVQCKPGLCQNGGTCFEKQNSYSCNCAKGFKGNHCEIKKAPPVRRRVEVQVRSEGCDDKGKGPGCGQAIIKVDGKDYSKHGRGYNFVVLDGSTGNVERQVSFDTHGNPAHVKNMINFLNGIRQNKIVLAAIQDEGKRLMTLNAYNALLKVGAVEPINKEYRGSFALIGFTKPGRPSFVKQISNGRGQGPSSVTATIPIPAIDCSNPKALGLESGKILDRQITASSMWAPNHGPTNGRLKFRAHGGRTGAWSAQRNDLNQWLQIDFEQQTVVTGISIQGREDCCNQFVKAYTISYSNDGRIFHTYKHNNQIKIFCGNVDKHSIVHHTISPAIATRFIRVHPRSWNEHISMRVDLKGCYKGKWSKMGRVCVGPRDNRFKDIIYPWKTPQSIAAMKLVHSKGQIGCHGSGRSNWGCVAGDVKINMVVTDLQNRVIYPPPRLVKLETGGWYTLSGFTSSSPELVFADFSHPKYLRFGSKLRIWYGEDLFNFTEGDNHGETCMEIWLYFLSI